MAIPVIMPKQGQSVESCIITRWFKKKGDIVHTGDILFSYETDKAAFDVESPAEGILLDLFFEEGSEVLVLSNVAVIGSSGEQIESFIKGKTIHPGGSEADSSESPDPAQPGVMKDIREKPVIAGDKIRISPRARSLAHDKKLDYRQLHGSGPNGRIIISDIEKVLTGTGNKVTSKKVETGADYSEKPLSNVRKLIARTMLTSIQNSAQLTHHMSADVRNLMEARRTIKNDLAKGYGKQDITLNDMICWCVIRALEKFPDVNSHFLDDLMRTFHHVHLGIAVDTPRGLMVPTVKDASDMNLITLSQELRLIAEECRKGSINPELIKSSSASFTISNLGNYGVEMFTPVINLPQVAILGVCTILYRPTDLGNGIFGFVPYMGLSLTYDHRAIDGGPATLFLKEVKEQIENYKY